jgi:predicted DCC family thiol-disulfide oxidoreductase YuxK
MEKNIVYFDGVCGLCNSFIDFLMRNDKRNRLFFTPLQGETAAARLGLNPTQKFDTVMFEEKGKIYSKSGAGLRILYTIGGFWKIFIILLIFPPFIRNFFYDIIANNRYKWFGKKESCRMPTKEERAKFLP